jgi:hypothetical protein
MAKITTIPHFSKKKLSAGDIGTSDLIDLRFNSSKHLFALAARANLGTAGTSGTTVFSYAVASFEAGTCIVPSAAVAIGTFGTGNGADVVTFTPPLAPFMKIIATQTGSGTSGKDSIVDAELIVQ